MKLKIRFAQESGCSDGSRVSMFVHADSDFYKKYYNTCGEIKGVAFTYWWGYNGDTVILPIEDDITVCRYMHLTQAFKALKLCKKYFDGNKDVDIQNDICKNGIVLARSGGIVNVLRG